MNHFNDLDISSMYAYSPPTKEMQEAIDARRALQPASAVLRIKLNAYKEALKTGWYGSSSKNPLVSGKRTVMRNSEYCRRVELMILAECVKRNIKTSVDASVELTDLLDAITPVVKFVVDRDLYVRLDKKARARLKKNISHVLNRYKLAQ